MKDRLQGLILDDYSLQVRFAALITVLALAEKLRENYIVLLPESIPFLAELMEGKSGANSDTNTVATGCLSDTVTQVLRHKSGGCHLTAPESSLQRLSGVSP